MHFVVAASVVSPGAAEAAPQRRPRFSEQPASPRAPPRPLHADRHVVERGVSLSIPAACFYNEAAVHARDLAVLALRATFDYRGGRRPRVLDATTGCGARAARYVAHAGADVVAADVNPLAVAVAAANLNAAGALSASRVVTEDANRLLTRSSLDGDVFDAVDVDAFGVGGVSSATALGGCRFGGLLLLSSTSAQLAGRGSALLSYGAVTHPTPVPAEQGCVARCRTRMRYSRLY